MRRYTRSVGAEHFFVALLRSAGNKTLADAINIGLLRSQVNEAFTVEQMLIDSFAPNPDAVETHSIAIDASPEAVRQALWTADLGGSLIIKALLGLRALPEIVLRGRPAGRRDRKITLQTVIDSGFGILADQPDEIVLGVTGRFWRPTGNLSPFNREDFDHPVPAGLARGVWNFKLERDGGSRTILSTETRVVCGDDASRRKFRVYWFFVRPFSGLIRRIMLRNVRQTSVCRDLS